MAYTSEQYKTLLLRKLQRAVHMPDGFAYGRAYAYNLYLKLMEGVEITEEIYNELSKEYDDALKLISEPCEGTIERTTYSGADYFDCGPGIFIENSELNTIFQPLQATLEKLGITLTVAHYEDLMYAGSGDQNSEPGDEWPICLIILHFVKSDGTEYDFPVSAAGNIMNQFVVNCLRGTEYSYAKRSDRYYNEKDKSVPNASDLDYHTAGFGTTWAYEEASKTLTISGDGAYAGVIASEDMGCGKYETLVLGANVSKLLKYCIIIPDVFNIGEVYANAKSASDASLLNLDQLKTIVCLRPETEKLEIATLQNARSTLTIFDNLEIDTRNFEVYTDNQDLINYCTEVNATTEGKYVLHPLSEWNG